MWSLSQIPGPGEGAKVEEREINLLEGGSSALLYRMLCGTDKLPLCKAMVLFSGITLLAETGVVLIFVT